MLNNDAVEDSLSVNMIRLGKSRFAVNELLGMLPDASVDERSFCYGYGEALFDAAEILAAGRPTDSTVTDGEIIANLIASVAGMWNAKVLGMEAELDGVQTPGE